MVRKLNQGFTCVGLKFSVEFVKHLCKVVSEYGCRISHYTVCMENLQ